MVVKLSDVAARAGVGYGTASRALSGKGRVSEAALARVQRAARELGYSRNAAAAILGSRQKRISSLMKLASITPHATSAQELLDEVCPEFGFEGHALDPVGFPDPGSMLRRLWHQGFDALFINFEGVPWSEAETLQADWSQFSVVKFKRVYPRLSFHLIRHSAFDYMRLTLDRVLATGARRVAVLLIESGSREDNEARLGAVLAVRELNRSRGIRIRFRTWAGSPGVADSNSLAWLAAQQPDVIVGVTWPLIWPLLAAGWRIPDKTGFAAVLRPSHEDHGLPFDSIAGCRVGRREILRRALIQLRDMIAFGARGFPDLAVEHVLEPIWEGGQTLSPNSPPPKKGRPPEESAFGEIR
jgi:DNA-binding LacI/PurR family transcriptional regulator